MLRNKVFRREISREAGEAALAAFRAQDDSLLHPEGIEEKAWDLAKQWNRPTCYDPTYLALAEFLNCEMWTADRRFVASLRKKVPRVRLISR